MIATIMDESKFIPDHLQSADPPREIVEILRTGEQVALDGCGQKPTRAA